MFTESILCTGTFLSSLAVLTHLIFMSPTLWSESEYEPISQTRHPSQTLHSLPTATRCQWGELESESHTGDTVAAPPPPPAAEAKAEGPSPKEGAQPLHPRDLRCSNNGECPAPSVSLQ